MPRKRNTKSEFEFVEKRSFEECIDIINEEIAKRRQKWTLTSISWMDYDDVSQILRIHINEKWYRYNPKQPLKNWINRIITNRIRNLIRDNYSNYSRPCLKCAAFEGENLCSIYNTQSEQCPTYAKWAATKRNAYNIKIPVSIEAMNDHSTDIEDLSYETYTDIESINKQVKKILKQREYEFYMMYFVDKTSEKEISEKMGFVTTEKNKVAGYKQMRNLAKKITETIKKAIEEGKIEI